MHIRPANGNIPRTWRTEKRRFSVNARIIRIKSVAMTLREAPSPGKPRAATECQPQGQGLERGRGKVQKPVDKMPYKNNPQVSPVSFHSQQI
jgi:hypothetical protein